MATRKKRQDDKKDFDEINEANTRYTQAKGYWSPFYAEIVLQKEFLFGDQWSPMIRQLREQDGRPVVQLPRIGNFIRQLKTQVRASKPSISVSSNDMMSKTQTDVVASIIRKIEASSQADSQYDHAAEDQITGGIGFLRLYSDYPNHASFEQDVFIEAIYDPTTVYIDPNSTHALFEDAEYVFIESKMTKQAYLNRVGSSKVADISKISGFRGASPLSIDDKHIIVLEYYRKQYSEKHIYKYANIITGEEVITEEKLEDDNFVLVDDKKCRYSKIIHSLFDGVEFHDTTEVPCEILPVIPVLGETTFINRQRKIKGAVKDSMDTQRIINYSASVELEVIDLAPKVPWLVEESSIDGYEDEWRNANSRNYAYLVYKGKNNVQPPSRAPVNTDITAIAAAKSQANEDLQAVFGIFDAALGASANETSGVAIQKRIGQSAQATFIYKDNLMRSIRQVGRVAAQMIPTIYNGRTLAVPSVSGEDSLVSVNINPLASFEVHVKEAPTDASGKEMVSDMIANIMSTVPTAAPLVADYLVKNSDLPNVEPLVARLQTLLPPEIRAAEAAGKGMTPVQMNQQLADSMQKTQTLIQQLDMSNQAVQQLQVELDKLKMDKTIEMKKLALEEEKLRKDFETKTKELLIDSTKVELDYRIAQQQQKLNEAKISVEATTGQNLDNIINAPSID